MNGINEGGIPPRDGAVTAVKRKQAWGDLRNLQDDGWFWSETTANLLLCPRDSQFHVWYDPFTCDLLFSPKMIELMAGLLEEDRDEA